MNPIGERRTAPPGIDLSHTRWLLPGLALAVGLGPFQRTILIFCMVIFLSMTLVWILWDLWPLRRGTAPEPGEKTHSERFARGFGGAAGLIGLSLVAAVLVYRIDLNQGLPDWNSMGFQMQVTVLAFTALASCITAGLLVFNVFAWKNRYWTLPARLHYLGFSLAWLLVMFAMYFWSRIGLRF